MVYVWASEVFSGVPEITPVVVLKLSPAGRIPEIEYVGVPLNSAGLRTAVGVMAVPATPEMVCVAGEMLKAAH
jgi:hypothetical protein